MPTKAIIGWFIGLVVAVLITSSLHSMGLPEDVGIPVGFLIGLACTMAGIIIGDGMEKD